MRKGAAGSWVDDPKFRIGVTSTFADVAYFRKACRFAADGLFHISLSLDK